MATIVPATWYLCPDGCGYPTIIGAHEINDEVWCYGCGKHHPASEYTTPAPAGGAR